MQLNDAKQLYKYVKQLYEYELFEDLLVFVELNLEDHKLFNMFSEAEQSYIYFYIAEAQFIMGHYEQSSKFYDNSLKTVLHMIKQSFSKNLDILSPTEIRFKLHKSLLKEDKIDEAIKVLESIPEEQSTPKVKFALAKLHLNMTRPSIKMTRASNPKWVKYFKGVTDQVPFAILCKSYLVDHGLLNAEDDPLINMLNIESKVWLLAKQAESNRKYIDAIEILSEFHTTNLRIVLELAHLYHIAGDKQKALASFERAHSLIFGNYSNVSGMDVYSSLLYAEEKTSELEKLASTLMSTRPNCSESFIAYGYYAMRQNKDKDALHFAFKALTVSNTHRQRSEAMLLKGRLLLKVKKYKEGDAQLQEALRLDLTNINIFDTLIRSLIVQRRFKEATLLAKKASFYLGDDNPRSRFLNALVLAEDEDNMNKAQSILEEVVSIAPYFLEAVFLLVKIYEKYESYEKAIDLLQKQCELTVLSQAYYSRLHKLLGDFLSKTNRPADACSQYRQALSSTNPDPQALNALNALNTIPALSTPECAVASAFCPAAPQPSRRQRRQFHAPPNLRGPIFDDVTEVATEANNEREEDEEISVELDDEIEIGRFDNAMDEEMREEIDLPYRSFSAMLEMHNDSS